MPATAPLDTSLPEPPLRARTLGFLLRELYGHLQEQVYQKVAAAGHPGLRPLHSPVLRHLPAGGGRVADLARATGLTKQSIAYVIDDLLGLGYLRAEADPEDGRAKRISYTARGQKVLAALVIASRDAESALAARVGKARLQELRSTLEDMLHDGSPSSPRPQVQSRNPKP